MILEDTDTVARTPRDAFNLLMQGISFGSIALGVWLHGADYTTFWPTVGIAATGGILLMCSCYRVFTTSERWLGLIGYCLVYGIFAGLITLTPPVWEHGISIAITLSSGAMVGFAIADLYKLRRTKK